MKNIYISTREVASLLSVTETTVKRWTNSKQLQCAKTLGGHRKYLLKDIENFAKENRIPISGITASPRHAVLDKAGYALYSKNMEQIITVVLEESIKGNRDGVFDLFIYLTKNGIRFVNLVDEVIKPVMEKVGYLWEKKQLRVEDEHIASDTIKTALSRLIVHLPHQKKKNIKVLCACVENEFHDIGIQSIAYELELSGYALHYLGANTPFHSIDMTIKKVKPSYSFISATSPNITEEEFIEYIKKTEKICKENNSKLILGGKYLQKFNNRLTSFEIGYSLKESKSFINNKSNK